MALTLDRKRNTGTVSRDVLAEGIGLVVGNDKGTYGMRQFYRNPHLSIIASDMQDIETALAGIGKRLQSDGYTIGNFLSDLAPQVEAMYVLYRRCMEEKHVSYSYSNRYHNEAENPWTQISSFLSASIIKLEALRSNAESAKTFAD